MELDAYKSYWNQSRAAIISLFPAIVLLLGSYLFEVSVGFYFTLGQFTLLPITGIILKRIAPEYEGLVDTILLSFFTWYFYFLSDEVGLVLPAVLMAIIFMRIGIHSIELRGKTKFWQYSLYYAPVIAILLVGFDVQPWFKWPLPTEKETIFISSVLFLVALIVVFQTHQGYITTIVQLEDKEKELSARYSQVLELNQILNHNLRTPLATATGQLEIAKLKNKDDVHIEKSRQALELVLEQTQSVNNAKKAFARSSTITEFFENWKTIYKYPMVELIIGKKVDSLNVNEQSMIALAVSLDIFTINSLEAGAEEIKIHVSRNENQILIRHVDNGPGVTDEMLEMFGKPINSQKGSGLGTYLAQRLLKSSGATVVQFANRIDHNGFEVFVAL